MSETEVQPGPETGAGGDDVRADVMAAFAKHSEPDTQPDPGTDPAAAETAEAPAAERPRNERGQFIKADGTVDTEAEAATPVPDADQVSEQPDTPSTASGPPPFLSAEAKAEWAKTPSAIQAALIKRDADANEGGRRWSEEKRAYDEMLAPVREQAQRAGVDEREGLNRLLSASAFLERDPANAIAWLAKTYGVDLSKPNDNPKQPASQPDPQFVQLHQKVQTLEQSIAQRERTEAQSAIQQFASAPGHEHFETVKSAMGQLIASGQAKDLNDAYEKAIWTDPTIRPQLIAAQTASAEAARRAKEKETADRARRGAISSNGSPAGAGAPVPKPEYATVEDAARAAWAKHAAG